MPALTFPQSPGSESQGKVSAIKVHTQLVLIPAEVTDSKGNRVTDMRKEDFAVFENGKRQERHVLPPDHPAFFLKPQALFFIRSQK